MAHLFSIPVETEMDPPDWVRAEWTIPAEAEAAVRLHHPAFGHTLESLFRARLLSDPVARGRWDWMLVVLPARYPIGGALAVARQGPNTNLLQIDPVRIGPEWLARQVQTKGTADSTLFPRYCTVIDPQVAVLCLPSKGLLQAMATAQGGWLATLLNQLWQVPVDGHWVYLADAPAADWIAQIEPINRALYQQWFDSWVGPDWKLDDQPIQRYLLESAVAAGYPEKRSFLERYLAKCPTDTRVRAYLAKAQFECEEWESALVLAEQVCAEMPEWLYAERLRLDVLCAGHMDIDERIRGLAKYLQRAPLDTQCLERLGNISYFRRDLARAVPEIRQLLDLWPFDAFHWLNLGHCHALLEDFVEAENCYEQALRRDPTNHLALNNYGYLLALRGDLDRAQVLVEAACRLIRTPMNLDSLGYIYMRRGDREEAERLFRESLALDPHFTEAIEHMKELGET